MADPVIQVIERADYKTHHLVTLPNEPFPQLPPSSIRVRTKFFTLSTNNFTYARLGHLFGWWDFHPLPANTPAPYNDASKYGRLSCWGIGVVTASTAANVPIGKKIYGYLPLGTLEVDKQITTAEEGVKNQFIETTEHRKDLMQGFYNRYMIVPDNASESDLAWDAVAKVLFETSYLVNQYAFTWDPEVHAPVFPLGNANGSWSAKDAEIGDSIVLVFAASSKTAAAFAQRVRQRPKKHQPKHLFAVGSKGSKAMTEKFGWYEEVLLYSDDPLATLERKASLDTNTKVRIIDFGARSNAASHWAAKLKSRGYPMRLFTIGSSPDGGAGRPDSLELDVLKDSPPIRCNASGLRLGAIDAVGVGRYFDQLEEAWAKFKANGGIPGVKFDIKDGLEPFRKDWEGLADGSLSPLKALLYRI
jgi:hypothetical protein